MATISDCYIQCSKSFSRLIQSLGTSTRDTNDRIPLKGTANEHSRFDVWAGSVGAKHAPNKRISLDYRLRDSSFYAARVVDILQRLDSTLNTVGSFQSHNWQQPMAEAAQPKFDRQRDDDSEQSSITSSAESSSSDEADMLTPEHQIAALYESITNSVRHLYSLAMVIRQPVATDRLSRASKITVDHFASFDQRHVDECFPNASLVLKKRLAKAITRRRQLLIYNEQHYRKSSEPQPLDETTAAGHIAQDEPGEKAEQEMPPPPVASHSIRNLVRDTPSYAPTISKGSLLASTEATKFIPPVDMREEPDIQSESGTITTFGFTGKDGVGIRVPPRPQDDNGEALEQFLCPLCYHLIEVKGEKAWTRHVFRDLQAYVCTFDNCETPDILFETRQDWLRHELENHRREWHCNDPKHKPHNSEPEFMEHMKSLHELQLPGPQLLSLAKLCERSSSLEVVPCPLCRDGCHDVVNGFECYKPSWAIRQVADDSCPESFDSEKPDMAKLPERHFSKITDSVLTKVTPWITSLPNDFAPTDPTQQPHETHPTIGQRRPCFILSTDLKRHIGQHLERLALFALNRSKLMPDDGMSVHTEDAVARSETSFESLKSASSMEGYGHGDHGKDAADVASKMNITLVDLATYEAQYDYQVLNHVHVKFEETQRLIRETFIKSVLEDEGLIIHAVISDKYLFSPEGSLECIITMESVLSAIFNTGEAPNRVDSETFKYTVIYTVATCKKLFSILVLRGMKGEELWHAMHFFNKNKICDKTLPLEGSDLGNLSKYMYELYSQKHTEPTKIDDLLREEHKGTVDLEFTDLFFNYYQWNFCAPVFSSKEALEVRHLDEKCILPFTEKCTNTDEDSYGKAIKYKIHRRHLVSNDMTQNPVYITVTRLSFVSMWQRELKKLKIIQELNQRHIVKLITTFRRGVTDFYFISETSDGGNLRDFWKTFPRVLTASLVRSVIEQLYGLVYASNQVNLATATIEGALASNVGLCPENILYFKDDSRVGHNIGTLKASHQSVATEIVPASSAEAQLYAPPEQGLLSEGSMWNLFFRVDDMWAMGCITLEFMVWLLYSSPGLSQFHNDLESGHSGPDSNRRFWEYKHTKVHNAVRRWIGHMAKDPVCREGKTALGDLLELITDRLLVFNVIASRRDTPKPDDGNDSSSEDPQVETTAELWDKHQGLVTRLYQDEGRRLQEVRDIMRTYYNFDASARSYRQRLNEWGISKDIMSGTDGGSQSSGLTQKPRAQAEEVLECLHRILTRAQNESYWLPSAPLPPPDIASNHR
ncbi:hypothetical protein FVER53590_13280 [Fusarium verticillioides]|nr:hypothetical protein FVER53590_13280 [Fusarium verticillioides]